MKYDIKDFQRDMFLYAISDVKPPWAGDSQCRILQATADVWLSHGLPKIPDWVEVVPNDTDTSGSIVVCTEWPEDEPLPKTPSVAIRGKCAMCGKGIIYSQVTEKMVGALRTCQTCSRETNTEVRN